VPSSIVNKAVPHKSGVASNNPGLWAKTNTEEFEIEMCAVRNESQANVTAPERRKFSMRTFSPTGADGVPIPDPGKVPIVVLLPVKFPFTTLRFLMLEFASLRVNPLPPRNLGECSTPSKLLFETIGVRDGFQQPKEQSHSGNNAIVISSRML
jgi:hypothetical protein